uniref:Zinc finger PHD-type domain-containing protein n=1 Tax=Globodera rostochiensis TaxID=31243 RepID=A0A914HNF9_GLORO
MVIIIQEHQLRDGDEDCSTESNSYEDEDDQDCKSMEEDEQGKATNIIDKFVAEGVFTEEDAAYLTAVHTAREYVYRCKQIKQKNYEMKTAVGQALALKEKTAEEAAAEKKTIEKKIEDPVQTSEHAGETISEKTIAGETNKGETNKEEKKTAEKTKAKNKNARAKSSSPEKKKPKTEVKKQLHVKPQAVYYGPNTTHCIVCKKNCKNKVTANCVACNGYICLDDTCAPKNMRQASRSVLAAFVCSECKKRADLQ